MVDCLLESISKELILNKFVLADCFKGQLE